MPINLCDTMRLRPTSKVLVPFFFAASWHGMSLTLPTLSLYISVFYISVFGFPTWFYSAKLLAQTALFIMQKSITYTEDMPHQVWGETTGIGGNLECYGNLVQWNL